MPMDLGTRNTLLCDFMHCMTAVSLEMSDEPNFFCFLIYIAKILLIQRSPITLLCKFAPLSLFFTLLCNSLTIFCIKNVLL